MRNEESLVVETLRALISNRKDTEHLTVGDIRDLIARLNQIEHPSLSESEREKEDKEHRDFLNIW